MLPSFGTRGGRRSSSSCEGGCDRRFDSVEQANREGIRRRFLHSIRPENELCSSSNVSCSSLPQHADLLHLGRIFENELRSTTGMEGALIPAESAAVVPRPLVSSGELQPDTRFLQRFLHLRFWNKVHERVRFF